MSLYRRGETWWVYVTHQGRRIRRSTGTSEKTEAQRIHDELKADAWTRKRGGAHLSDALKLWLKASPRTNHERNSVRLFLELYPDRPLCDITGPDIAAALAGKGAAHANRIINTLRAALNLAHQAGLCDTPPKIPRRKTPTTRLRWLTREEWQTLYAVLPAHLKPMALFAVSTGLRAANVFGLRWERVDMARRVAWIDATESKGRKAIGVPLSDAALKALAAVHGQHPEYVFTWRGGPVLSVKRSWGRALERAGLGYWEEEGGVRKFVPNLTWHDLRHTWASWHVQAGTPLAVLRELGGWSNMDMVMRYSHLAPDHLAGWANNANHATIYATAVVETRAAPVAQWIEQPPPKGRRSA